MVEILPEAKPWPFRHHFVWRNIPNAKIFLDLALNLPDATNVAFAQNRVRPPPLFLTHFGEDFLQVFDLALSGTKFFTRIDHHAT
jgi:hypothetical protein